MTLTPWQILLVPLGIVLLAGVFITINRYITYRERVELARLGFSLEDLTKQAAQAHRGNSGVLWGGVITAAGGVALLLGLSTLGTGVWLLGGLIPLFVGLGMVLIYLMTRGAPASPATMGEEGTDGQGATRILDAETARGNGSSEPNGALPGSQATAIGSSAARRRPG